MADVTEPVAPSERAARAQLALYLSDFPRAIGGFGFYFATRALLRARAPRGDGHPVLILPGLLAGDVSTLVLRRYLRQLGYEAHGWGLGRNIGPTPQVVHGIEAKFKALVERHEQKVSVIGWSLGGIYARVLARLEPDDVRQVITLGSPYRLEEPRRTRAYRAYMRYSRLHVEDVVVPTSAAAADPLPMPTTSVYSKLDGIVPWDACMEEPGETRESIEVLSSHFGFGHDPAVLWIVADRLAQPEGDWKPFEPPSFARALFRRPS
ncbi:MAG TPA: alpha/beta hydrolase [Actinomycetota bacterium]|nr:alpha/beta hydrolase [Actinomycetota bacterium]